MKRNISKILLDTKAVFLSPKEPFTWASGIRSPIYCDNRLLLSVPESRDVIEKALADTIKMEYPEVEILMGTGTAGIPHAAIVADMLDLPMGYVRGSAKGHGRKNQIEGRLNSGDKVVVVEDLISTAGSAVDAANTLREAGADVLGIVSIFTYGMQKGLDRLSSENLKNFSLADLDTLVSVAMDSGYISKEDGDKLLAFRENPSDESWMNGAGK